jgi:hypothetical protein
MAETIFIKLGMYIMAPDPISKAYFINPCHQSVSVARQRFGKNPTNVAMQQLGKNVIAAMNTQATIKELLDATFSMRSVSYQEKYAIISCQNFLFLPTTLIPFFFPPALRSFLPPTFFRLTPSFLSSFHLLSPFISSPHLYHFIPSFISSSILVYLHYFVLISSLKAAAPV